jgi:hypothetical protein
VSQQPTLPSTLAHVRGAPLELALVALLELLALELEEAVLAEVELDVVAALEVAVLLLSMQGSAHWAKRHARKLENAWSRLQGSEEPPIERHPRHLASFEHPSASAQHDASRHELHAASFAATPQLRTPPSRGPNELLPDPPVLSRIGELVGHAMDVATKAPRSSATTGRISGRASGPPACRSSSYRTSRSPGYSSCPPSR